MEEIAKQEFDDRAYSVVIESETLDGVKYYKEDK